MPDGAHPVALCEALDVLHRAMRLTLYRCIAMAIKIASDSPAFLLPSIQCRPLPYLNNIVIVNKI